MSYQMGGTAARLEAAAMAAEGARNRVRLYVTRMGLVVEATAKPADRAGTVTARHCVTWEDVEMAHINVLPGAIGRVDEAVTAETVR
jgi:hypothetical protein